MPESIRSRSTKDDTLIKSVFQGQYSSPQACSDLDGNGQERLSLLAKPIQSSTLMTEYATSAAIATIQACEAAIARVRVAIRAGTQHEETVGRDLMFIQEAIEERFIRYAKRASSLGPEAFEETLDALNDQLLDDIWSLGYQTMETKFGAYLTTRPLRVLQKIARKYGRTSVSYSIERLDQLVAEDGQILGDTIADPITSAAIDQIADDDERQAMIAQVYTMIDRMPSDERFAVKQRMNGRSNNEIANDLGVSIATASRIYHRAVERLRTALGADGGVT